MRVLWRKPKPVVIDVYAHPLFKNAPVKVEFRYPKGNINLMSLRMCDNNGDSIRASHLRGWYYCDCGHNGTLYIETKVRLTQTRIRHYRRTFK